MTSPAHSSRSAEALPPFLYPLPADTEPDWLKDLRARAFDIYHAHGLPTRRHEAWRYTDLSFLAETPFTPSPSVTLDRNGLESAEILSFSAPRIVLVNGHFCEHLSNLSALELGISIQGFDASPPDSVRSALERGSLSRALDTFPMAALNTALFQSGLVITVEPGVAIRTPIHVVSLALSSHGPHFSVPRIVVHLQKGASLSLVESLGSLGAEPTFANSVTSVLLDEGAHLSTTRLVRERPDSSRIETTLADLGPDARYDNLTLVFGGRLVRNEVYATLNGAGAHAEVRGIYGARTGEHVDNTIFVDHVAPQATSGQLFKGVLGGTGRAVFQGRINVGRGASGTDGQQLHKAMLLSRGAEVDIKPELYIYNDDVACSHGATVGELDEDALFYLQSRGLTREVARSLLVEAFLSDMLEVVSHAPLREALESSINTWKQDVLSAEHPS
ncbi:Fe-S cluster assembly protein SufD [Phaeovibrio sulfidiphilus]|uniref:Fe-S cluster assembly protein SufD n=1 Tax=Phaeovibrio sulfidiphilus TaxID=1220600 RepID=A0A8J6YNC7_9PROT|nr:Fe-S cluster assembly protein SufD [Phaeovibrio sulfidiphilus]MBE1237685.1 Fe-S cluster assembly protein SufD [Phaeovibrio sulfidiphilus]